MHMTQFYFCITAVFKPLNICRTLVNESEFFRNPCVVNLYYFGAK
jgi:hypothetical protein